MDERRPLYSLEELLAGTDMTPDELLGYIIEGHQFASCPRGYAVYGLSQIVDWLSETCVDWQEIYPKAAYVMFENIISYVWID